MNYDKELRHKKENHCSRDSWYWSYCRSVIEEKITDRLERCFVKSSFCREWGSTTTTLDGASV